MLALGMEAAVILFSVMNALVVHPLSLAEADRLFLVQQKEQGDIAMSYLDYRDLRDRNTVFSELAAYHFHRFDVETKNGTQTVWGGEVSGNYFATLGVSPLLGRLIEPTDDRKPNASPYVVLSYACWRDRFGGDAEIAGKTIRIHQFAYTVLGVTPENFRGTQKFPQAELYVPVMDQEQLEGYDWLRDRSNRNLWLVGKLKPGATQQEATVNLNSIAAQLAREYPMYDEYMQLKLIRPGLFAMCFPIRCEEL